MLDIDVSSPISSPVNSTENAVSRETMRLIWLIESHSRVLSIEDEMSIESGFT